MRVRRTLRPCTRDRVSDRDKPRRHRRRESPAVPALLLAPHPCESGGHAPALRPRRLRLRGSVTRTPRRHRMSRPHPSLGVCGRRAQAQRSPHRPRLPQLHCAQTRCDALDVCHAVGRGCATPCLTSTLPQIRRARRRRSGPTGGTCGAERRWRCALVAQCCRARGTRLRVVGAGGEHRFPTTGVRFDG
jgi:hypothetical protein